MRNYILLYFCQCFYIVFKDKILNEKSHTLIASVEIILKLTYINLFAGENIFRLNIVSMKKCQNKI